MSARAGGAAAQNPARHRIRHVASRDRAAREGRRRAHNASITHPAKRHLRPS